MSKEEQIAVGQQPTKVDKSKVDDDNSPGKQLIKAREALGLTQKQIADRLHLRLHSVQAVEQDALEEGVSVTFNKGYVRLYAKLVHLEAEPLLEAYDRIHKRDNQPAKLQSFSRRVTREAHDYRWNLVTIVVVILVLGSVVGWWIQQSDSFEDSQSLVANTFESLFSESELEQSDDNIDQNTQGLEDDTEAANDDAEVLRLTTGPEISEEAVAELEDKTNSNELDIGEEEISSSVEQDSQSIDDDMAPLGDNISDITDTVLTTTDEVIDDNSEQQSDLVDGARSLFSNDSGIVVNDDGTVAMVFTFLDDCWVSVKDVNDEVIAIGVKTKGRVMEVSGLPPIKLILGTAQNVEINFGGIDVDMSPYPGGRSANFTLPVEND